MLLESFDPSSIKMVCIQADWEALLHARALHICTHAYYVLHMVAMEAKLDVPSSLSACSRSSHICCVLLEECFCASFS